jgi:hypothetical protein
VCTRPFPGDFYTYTMARNVECVVPGCNSVASRGSLERDGFSEHFSLFQMTTDFSVDVRLEGGPSNDGGKCRSSQGGWGRLYAGCHERCPTRKRRGWEWIDRWAKAPRSVRYGQLC